MTRFLRCAVGFSLLLAILAPRAVAQQPSSEEELIKKREAKLQEDWIKANPWTTDYDEARAQAKETGKMIFAYFTRSYAY